MYDQLLKFIQKTVGILLKSLIDIIVPVFLSVS